MADKRTIERTYYIYVLQWYDPYPKAEIEEDEDGNPYAYTIRENGEARPVAMTSIDKLKTLVKGRINRDDWETIHHNKLWRCENYWIERCMLGYDLVLDEMEYIEHRGEETENGGKRWDLKKD